MQMESTAPAKRIFRSFFIDGEAQSLQSTEGAETVERGSGTVGDVGNS
jgi:hypothetical protein